LAVAPEDTRKGAAIAPQNLEAEESVLGAMLVAPHAISSVLVEVRLRPEDFYRDSHRAIYRAILSLNDKNEAVDPLTVSAELEKRGELQAAGGKPYVHQLAAVVPAVGHARHYAKLVKDEATLRRLLGVAQTIEVRVAERRGEAHQLVEDSERQLFDVAHGETSGDFRSIDEILHEEIDKLEQLSREGQSVTGTPAGFRDLDEITGGFQRSNLIVLAARPSMGKSALVTNIAENVALRSNKPVALFSLEMSVTELAQRFVASQARMPGDKLRKGQVARNDWPKVLKACQALERAPLWIDDSSDLDVLELRAKARRLHAKEIQQGRGGLGLVIVDYLQLMRADPSADSRVEQVGQMSRGLKILARELEVPVIAVSQLNRSPEQRPDKRPLLSDLRECVTGDTPVVLADGRRVPIRELVGTTPEVVALDEDDRLTTARSDKVWPVGHREVFLVRLASGRTLRATANHRVRCGSGWQKVGELTAGERIALARRLPEPAAPDRWPEDRVVLLGQLIGDGSYLPGQPLRYTTASEDNSRAVAEAAKREFDARVSRYDHKGWHQLVLAGNGNRWAPAGINRWLRDLGVFGQRSHQKRVPAAAFRLPDDQIALLLRHLWATDGTVWIGLRADGRVVTRVAYATNSPGLAMDVTALLLRLGIIARTREVSQGAHRSGHHVVVSGGEAQQRFLETVGAFGPRVPMADTLRLHVAATDTNTNVDTLPHEAWQEVKAAMAAGGVTQRAMAALRGTAYGGTAHFRFAPSRATIASYGGLLGDPSLLAMAEDDLFWDRVVTIEPAGTEEVYDLTVPGPACWLADGIVSHNSGQIEQDADLVMFIYRDEYYNEETEKQGVAEISIAKHRNGPAGVKVELSFLTRFPKFANIARVESGVEQPPVPEAVE
jgi:replicative DNA helicase